jgi:hypothetical protein
MAGKDATSEPVGCSQAPFESLGAMAQAPSVTIEANEAATAAAEEATCPFARRSSG